MSARRNLSVTMGISALDMSVLREGFPIMPLDDKPDPT